MQACFYTAKECSEIDQRAMREMGLAETQLMQRAAQAAMDQIEINWPKAQRISIYCGPGNNGGDGYLLAVAIQKTGREVDIFALGEPKTDAAVIAKECAVSSKVKIYNISNKVSQNIDNKSDLIVDALFGHGLLRGIEAPLTELFDQLNQFSTPIFALDMPSGINSDTGAVLGCALKVKRTICFVAPKPGLVTGAGVDYAGTVCHSNLAISPEVFEKSKASFNKIDQQSARQALPQPDVASHKGDMGHVCIVGGQTGMIGAAILAGSGAARSGAGRVTVLSHEQYIASVQQVNPVLMTQSIAEEGAVGLPESIDTLVLGPGLGMNVSGDGKHGWSETVFKASLAAAMQMGLSMVVDADGLNLLAENTQRYDRWVLTPHPKEASRLLGCSTADIQADRPAACREIAAQFGGVCVLKGKGSLVTKATGQILICTNGNWGMATAGSGDVLSGIIGALLASGVDIMDAASVGVYVHAIAGDKAAIEHSKRAMIATDIIDSLPQVFLELESLQTN